MAVIKGDGGNNAVAPGTNNNDVMTGGGGNDQVWGNAGDDYIGGDYIGTHIPTRTGGAGYSVANAVDSQLGSAATSTSGSTTSFYTFSNTTSGAQAVNYDIYYVEPDGTITWMTQVIAGATRSIAVRSAEGNFIAVDTSSGEIHHHFSATASSSTPLDAVVSGDDNLAGYAGNDTIFGNEGDDTIYGERFQANDNTLTGDDYLDGGEGNDTIYGGGGNDKIGGGTGDDTIYGENGADNIVGGAGQDTIFGGAGNDTIRGDGYIIIDRNATAGTYSKVFGTGLSAANSQSNTNTVTYNFTHQASGGFEVYYVEPNGDLRFLASVTTGNVTTLQLPADTTFAIVKDNAIVGLIDRSETGTGGTFNIANYADPEFGSTAPGAAADIIDGGAGNDTIYSEGGDDRVDGGTGADFIHTSTGNDTVIGGEGADTIQTGTGDDIIYGESESGAPVAGSSFNDHITAGEGNDTVYGQQGDDAISGGTGADQLYGGEGADTIIGGGDADYMEGGTGDDVMIGDGLGLVPLRTTASQTVANFIGSDAGSATAFTGPSNGAGKTAVTFTNNNTGGQGITVYYIEPDGTLQTASMGVPLNQSRTFYFPDNSNVLLAESGTGRVLGYYENVEDQGSITLTTGNDDALQFAPPGGADEMYGGDGDDMMMGRDGNDLIYGDAGADTIDGGAADDTIYGGADDDTVRGGTGADTIEGNAGQDTLLGEAGTDTISGGAGDDIIDGGEGADTVSGGSGNDDITVGGGDIASGNDDRDAFIIDRDQLAPGDSITIDGGTGSTAAGDVDDYDSIDLSGLTITDYSLTRDADGNSWSGIVNVSDGTNSYRLDIVEIEEPICFTPGVLIETDQGPRAVETLQIGDLVLTKDHGLKPVRWIGRNRLSATMLDENENYRPIRIRAGALAPGYPAADLIVSPQHRILIRSRIAARMFGADEVLVAAKQLLQIDGVEQVNHSDGVDYIHFLLDQHEIVYANGAESESLYTGPQALKSVGAEARAEILSLFPELRDIDYRAISARQLPSGKLARKLVTRHQRNSKPLVM
ncbi:Hint domain-containing protein [Paracoccaceae bacterium GXU_MW_L88]